MTIKLILLKSGEDLIADVQEMLFGEESDARVVGYYLNKPCIIKMISPNPIEETDNKNLKKMGYQVSLYPWIPLTSDETIPVPSDWVVTIVEPTSKLKEMYIEDVVNYGKNNQSNIADQSTNSDQSN